MADDDEGQEPEIEAPPLGTLTVLWGGAEDTPPVATRRVERKEFCRHLSVLLDHDARRVYCAACEAEVPAFDALKTLASEWERFEHWYKSHESRAKQAAKELEEVQRKLRNAKAQLRRAAKKAAPVVPDSVEDVVLRWLAAWRRPMAHQVDDVQAGNIGRHVRWLLMASDREQEKPGDWLALRRDELARERGEAEVHDLRPET